MVLVQYKDIAAIKAALCQCLERSWGSEVSSNKRILIVDDEEAIREPVGYYLESQGFEVSLASNASEALAVVNNGDCDMAVLDVMLGEDDGFSLCREIRKVSDVPVIFLSGRTEETERIIGLELGADDYVIKPFNPRELLARIRSVLRRFKAEESVQPPQAAAQPTFGGWTLDVPNQEVIAKDGTRQALSTGEARLLQVFINHPNVVLTRDQLLEMTQGRQANAFDRSIDNYVSRIRKKIEANPGEPKLLKTHWGGGYALSCDS